MIIDIEPKLIGDEFSPKEVGHTGFTRIHFEWWRNYQLPDRILLSTYMGTLPDKDSLEKVIKVPILDRVNMDE